MGVARTYIWRMAHGHIDKHRHAGPATHACMHADPRWHAAMCHAGRPHVSRAGMPRQHSRHRAVHAKYKSARGCAHGHMAMPRASPLAEEAQPLAQPCSCHVRRSPCLACPGGQPAAARARRRRWRGAEAGLQGRPEQQAAGSLQRAALRWDAPCKCAQTRGGLMMHVHAGTQAHADPRRHAAICHAGSPSIAGSAPCMACDKHSMQRAVHGMALA